MRRFVWYIRDPRRQLGYFDLLAVDVDEFFDGHLLVDSLVGGEDDEPLFGNRLADHVKGRGRTRERRRLRRDSADEETCGGECECVCVCVFHGYSPCSVMASSLILPAVRNTSSGASLARGT